MKNKKLFILHFRPIENYPPVQNFINSVFDSENELVGTCISTKGKMNKIFFSEFKIFRFGNFDSGKLNLWLCYVWFNISAIIKLLFQQPNHLIYYESLSAFPAYVYKRFVNKKAHLYIHYHEYTSIEEYQKSSPIEKFIHSLESYIYPLAVWISHTNRVRLDKFLVDEKLVFNSEVHHFLPNYPTKKWAIQNERHIEGQELRLVYFGYSLTKEGSYLDELVNFLSKSEIQAKLSIYCLKRNEFVNKMEGSHGRLSVRVYHGLAYSEIPKILRKQHVGLILYKAKTPNYIYNAPNKLFEYLSCGLDVWYPSEMQGIYEYDSSGRPLVKRIKFNQLKDYKLNELLSVSQVSQKRSFSAEEVYSGLINKMQNE